MLRSASCSNNARRKTVHPYTSGRQSGGAKSQSAQKRLAVIFIRSLPTVCAGFIRLFAVTLLALSISLESRAQIPVSSTDGTTPSGMAPGAPVGSYPLSNFEHINYYNGSLSAAIPLFTLGGRGDAQSTVTLNLSSIRWRIKANPFYDEGVGSVQWNYFAVNQWWNWEDPDPPNYVAGVLAARFIKEDPVNAFTDRGIPYVSHYGGIKVRLSFAAPDGTEYNFYDQKANGAAQGTNLANQRVYFGRVFTQLHNGGATFVSDNEIESDNSVSSSDMALVTGWLYLPTGTRYRISDGLVSKIIDRNGNSSDFVVEPGMLRITDSLNREVTVAYNVNMGGQYGTGDMITYKGFGGEPKIIRVTRTTLSNALRQGFSIGNLFPQLRDTFHLNPANIAKTLWLPDGRKYEFRYNNFGEIARIELPTGGAIEYDYAAGVLGGPSNGLIGPWADTNRYLPNDTPSALAGVYRRLVTRRVYQDSNSSVYESRQEISRPESIDPSVAGRPFQERNSYQNQGYVEVITYDYGGGQKARTMHYYSSIETPYISITSHSPHFSDKPWAVGKEIKTEVFDVGSPGSPLLRSVEYTLGATHIDEIKTTLVDTDQVSKQSFLYDSYNNRTDIYEYDFGSGSPPAHPVRHTHIDYLTTNSVNGLVYDTPYPIDPANPVIHIRNLPSKQIVYSVNPSNGAETRTAQTEYEYDNYNPEVSNHADLLGRSNISGMDGAYTATNSKPSRGNVTAVTRYKDAANLTGPVTAHQQYDVAGNIIKAIDADGNPTIFDFSDRFGSPDDDGQQNTPPAELNGQTTHAFATKVTNALGHEAYMQYDYYLGKPVNSEDANGIVSSVTYNDILDRPTQSIQARYKVGVGVPAERRQTTSTYDDANRVITTTSDRDAFNENILTSKSYYDGLGRTRRGASHEGVTWSIADTQFDALGRVSQVSNPYRAADPGSASPPPDLWTTTDYDGLGRVIRMTTPDGGRVDTAYSGNKTTVTDQAGKKRRSETDALGRLIKVIEDPGNFNYETFYSYDALGNLRLVTQGSQTRTFVYDSLSRLTSATNPESGTVMYAYDPNGNLTEKTDARGVRTTMDYDALNRVISKAYSGTTPGGTAAANLTPPVNYFYDSYSGLPSGAPSFSGTPSKGRLVGVTYGPGSEGTYYKYDAAGRIVTNHQRMGTSNYVTTYFYNRAGAVTREDRGSPARRRSLMSYDEAGRLLAMQTGHFSGFGFVFTDLVNDISYTPFGGLQSETYGNGLIHSMGYNNRLQPTEIRLGRPDNLESIFTIYNIYGTAHNVNGQDAEITAAHNNGNIARIKYSVSGTVQYSQTFQYDPLNRLSYAVEHNNGVYNDGDRAWYQTFAYDPYGNRGIDVVNTSDNVDAMNSALQLADFSGANNRITRLGYAYDSAGNLTEEPGKSYTYDAENRIVTATVAVGGTSQYFYDGNGQRVKKIVGGVTTRFEYGAGGELIAERNDSGVVIKDYFYKGGGLLATTKSGVNGEYEYTASDHLGTPRAWTDGSGNLVAGGRHDYLPFGEELSAGIGIRSAALGYGADSTRQKFTGKERDGETGLDYFGARYFASVQGRFTSPDPLEYWMIKVDKRDEFAANPQRWNKYVYVLNNPLRYVDPDGLAEIPDWAGLDEVRKRDLAKRLGTDAEKIWNGWNPDQRQRVLNARAVLIEAGAWANVTSITFGDLKKERNLLSKNTASFTSNQKGWFLAITTDRDIGPILNTDGWENRYNPNHPENQTNWMQPGDGIVMHLGQLIPPDDKYSWIHFDTGGGRITSSEHFEEWRTGKGGASNDDVTRAIGKTKAGKYLMGISESMDKLLTQPKK